MDKIPDRLAQYQWMSDLEQVVINSLDDQEPTQALTKTLQYNKGPEEWTHRESLSPYWSFPEFDRVSAVEMTNKKRDTTTLVASISKHMSEVEILGSQNEDLQQNERELQFMRQACAHDHSFLLYLWFFFDKTMRRKELFNFTLDVLKDKAILPVCGVTRQKKDLYLVYGEQLSDDLLFMVHFLKPPRAINAEIEAPNFPKKLITRVVFDCYIEGC